jgi:hypothetical protein
MNIHKDKHRFNEPPKSRGVITRKIARNILKNHLKDQGINHKKFNEFWSELRIKAIKKLQKLGLYRSDKEPYIIYLLKRRQGRGKAMDIPGIYRKPRATE